MSLLDQLPLGKDAPPEGACVKLERPEPGLVVLRIDPPHKKLPVFDLALMRDLELAVVELEQDDALVGLVVTGRDPTTFVAGADLDVIEAIEDEKLAYELARTGQRLFARLGKIGERRVAAVGGAVPGGACELALALGTIVLADHPSSRIGLPEVRLGILPGWGGTQRLPRRLGLPRALEAILSGKLYGPREALRIGLVDRLTPPEYLARVAADLALGRARLRPRSRRTASVLVDRNPLARLAIERQARERVLAETHGHYPAPLAALRLAAAATHTPLDRGLEREARALAGLAVSPVCKNLVSLFRSSEEQKRLAKLPDGKEARTLGRAGVVGAGVMGAGIASLFAKNGVATRLADVAEPPLDAAVIAHRREIARSLARRRLALHEADAAVDRLETGVGLAGFARCELIVEAVAEKLEVKQKVLGGLAQVVSADSILATNTSSLSVEAIARELPHPERVVGMHFFNPVARMPLVEIVRARATSDGVVAAIAKLALALGKTPVVVRDVAGFLVNRLLGPYLDEAVRLFAAGVEAERIDAVARGFGMPMGPLELIDEVGFDIAAHAAASLEAAYGERMRSSSLVRNALEAGVLGKKGGAGFYLYAADADQGRARKSTPNPTLRALAGAAGRTLEISDAAIQDQMLLAMAAEAVRALEEGVAATAREIDLASVFGMGFPPFRGGLLRWCDALGAAEVCRRLASIAGAPEVLARTETTVRFQPPPLLAALAKSGGRIHGT